VQGRSDPQRELLDVESVAGHLLPAGGVFAFLAAHRVELFPDAMFADLFASGRGRPSVPAPVVATVLVLQALHGLSDREAAEAVTFDLRWKAACGLPVTAAAFHPTTLTYWRGRLAGSERPNRVFEAVREVVAATGALAGRTRRALDSTVLDDAVATQDTVTQLVAAVRRVARTLPGGSALVAGAATCSGHDYTQPGKPAIAWDDADARAGLIDALVRDARAVLAAVAAAEQAGNLVLEGAAADAVGLLSLVAGQDVELVADPDDPDGPGTWRVARRVAPDRVISTVDPEARHAHKTTSRRQDGFKAHVVVEPDTGIITACAVTKASGEGSGDGAAGIALLADDVTLPAQEPVEVLADSAYGTGDMLAALAAAGHVPVVKPWPVNPAVPGGFTVDDFTVDHKAGSVTCPAGLTRSITRSGQVVFGAGCRRCPLRERCTRSATGKSMQIREHDALQRAHRARAADPDWRATYRRHRPMVERSLAWLTRGNRRLRYRGTTKNDAWLQLRAGALNLRRLLTLGLQRTDGAWALI
jgi:IS5 family transposase